MPISVEGKGPSLEPWFEPLKQQPGFRRELLERGNGFIELRRSAFGGLFPILIFRAACQSPGVLKGREVQGFTPVAPIRISPDLPAPDARVYFMGGVCSPLLEVVIHRMTPAGLFLCSPGGHPKRFASPPAPRRQSG